MRGALCRNNRYRIPQDRILRQQGRKPPIKRSQSSPLPDRQVEQDSIGQLVMSHDTSANLIANIRKSTLERPEAMRGVGRHLGQSLHRVLEENRDLHYRRLHRQPRKRQLR